MPSGRPINTHEPIRLRQEVKDNNHMKGKYFQSECEDVWQAEDGGAAGTETGDNCCGGFEMMNHEVNSERLLLILLPSDCNKLYSFTDIQKTITFKTL